MSIREFIATVKHNLNSSSLDTYISNEYIYNVGISISKLLIKRESDTRRLFRNTSNFKYINCIEMEEVPISECTMIAIPNCKRVMRSKVPLPSIFSSIYGSIMFVFNIDKSKDYIETNPINYKSIVSQEFKSKTKGYFWIENGYLVIPDSQIEVVTIYALFSTPIDIEGNNSCGKILDMDFPSIEYLLSSVIDLTTQSLLTGKQLPPDENSNLNAIERQ